MVFFPLLILVRLLGRYRAFKLGTHEAAAAAAAVGLSCPPPCAPCTVRAFQHPNTHNTNYVDCRKRAPALSLLVLLSFLSDQSSAVTTPPSRTRQPMKRHLSCLRMPDLVEHPLLHQ